MQYAVQVWPGGELFLEPLKGGIRGSKVATDRRVLDDAHTLFRPAYGLGRLG
jgi:hypothetical protein